MYYQIWQSTHNRQWYWHLRAANHEIIASSAGDGYHNKQDCLHGIALVKASSNAPVYESK